jgi:hypothetical protein
VLLIESNPELSYTEVLQNNPIRFIALEKRGENYHNSSNWFKCRDFFNDIVAAHHGSFYSIYGFDNERVSIGEDGLLVGVKQLLNHEIFLYTLENIVNKELEVLSCKITYKWVEGILVLAFPLELLKCTYYMSLATWLIRNSNGSTKYSSLNGMVECSNEYPSKPSDTVLKYKFNIPEYLKEYWWYFSDTANSVTTDEDELSETILSCGMNFFMENVE